MNGLTIEQLATRTDAEISIIFGMCNATMRKHPPLSPKWRAAQSTADNILRLRRQRGPRDLGYRYCWKRQAAMGS